MGWAFGFLNYSAMVATMAEAEGVYLRTIDEGAGIPTKEAHAVSYESAKWIFDVVRQQKIDFRLEEVAAEREACGVGGTRLARPDLNWEMETRLSACRRHSTTDLWTVPSPRIFIPEAGCLGSAIEKALRYLDFGNLPIPEEAKAYHRKKSPKRERGGKETRLPYGGSRVRTFANAAIV